MGRPDGHQSEANVLCGPGGHSWNESIGWGINRQFRISEYTDWIELPGLHDRESWRTWADQRASAYPDLLRAYRNGSAPKPGWNPRCPNKVRYEMLTRLGYFVTESSEHFAGYTPYFIKEGREDLIEKFGIPLDEYPNRCIENIQRWKEEVEQYRKADKIEGETSKEYASAIINSVWTGEPSVVYGNVRNNGCITSLPMDCIVEVPCLVDANGVQPTVIGDLPAQLNALIRTNVNVHEFTVRAMMTENREHIYHAAMMDPHTAAELDLDQIWALVDDLLASHGTWLPSWTGRGVQIRAA